jgi:competence protein ComEA
MEKHSFFRLSLVFLLLFSIIALSGCTGNNEIEIKLAPKETAYGRIFVNGRIDEPGYLPFEDTDSLQRIFRMAGGTLPDADLNRLELYIPSKTEAKKPQKIDINRAEAWLLTALPGVGEVVAGRIVAYREKNGLFRSIDELARVEGIGETTLSKIQNLVNIAE